MRIKLPACAVACLLLFTVAQGFNAVSNVAAAATRGSQRGRARSRRRQPLKICGNPEVTCPTSAHFEPYDLPFRIPANAVIWETEPFYAVILKSSADANCENFVSEAERTAAQSLFPQHKVFASRCAEAGALYYTGVGANQMMLAVYAGANAAEAAQMLARVKATGRFPGANIRRMRAGFNGT